MPLSPNSHKNLTIFLTGVYLLLALTIVLASPNADSAAAHLCNEPLKPGDFNAEIFERTRPLKIDTQTPLTAYTRLGPGLDLPPNVRLIKWSQFSDVHRLTPTLGDGGSSTSFKASLKGKDVFVKTLTFATEDSPWLMNNELHFANEFSKRGLTARLVAVTKVSGKFAIVTEFLSNATYLKTLSERNMGFGQITFLEANIRKALTQCRECRPLWSTEIQALTDFLATNHVSISDPQLALLPNGRVYMYDLANLSVQPADNDNTRATIQTINRLADMIAATQSNRK